MCELVCDICYTLPSAMVKLYQLQTFMIYTWVLRTRNKDILFIYFIEVQAYSYQVFQNTLIFMFVLSITGLYSLFTFIIQTNLKIKHSIGTYFGTHSLVCVSIPCVHIDRLSHQVKAFPNIARKYVPVGRCLAFVLADRCR